jgi:hypothetical protein
MYRLEHFSYFVLGEVCVGGGRLIVVVIAANIAFFILHFVPCTGLNVYSYFVFAEERERGWGGGVFVVVIAANIALLFG